LDYHTEKGVHIQLMIRKLIFSIILILTSFACNLTATPPPNETKVPTNTVFSLTDASTSPAPTETVSASLTAVITDTPSGSKTPVATVTGLKAKVIADLLSCRYGPGPEYLYLFAFRKTANIQLIGRVDAENWNWVLVENSPTKCWVNAKFLELQGDPQRLPIVYPGIAKLPTTPYYPPSKVLSTQRNKDTNEVNASWVAVPISPGDYEDETMFNYIVEVWRCENGQILFEPLPTNVTFVTFIDEPGCSAPSHGRVFVQEKHGYAGPAEIPWPPYSP